MSKYVIPALALLAGLTANAQQNFTYQPAHPKPGDVITVLYTPAGDLAKTTKTVEAVYYLHSGKGVKADDLKLVQNGNSYMATVATDTLVNLVQLGFYADETFDNNFNEGYQVQLWDGDKVCKGSFASLSNVYSSYGSNTGLDPDPAKALVMLEKERALYPDNKKATEWTYYYLLGKVKKDTLLPVIEKEVEAAMKAGLATEDDYSRVANLYSRAKLNSQSAFITSLKKEKFPDGKWKMTETVNKAFAETDPAKREQMAAEILAMIATVSGWKDLSNYASNLRSMMLQSYAAAGQWDSLKKFEADTTMRVMLASAYNDRAWKMQEENGDLKKAEELSAWATAVAKKEVDNPSQPKPDYLTSKNWRKNREKTYSMYTDTYAMIEYKLGNYDKGFPYAEAGALTINKGQDADQNNTYSLLAEKALKPADCMDKLSQFVKDGKAGDSTKAILQRVYAVAKGSADGFADYYAGLEKEGLVKLEAEIKKSMISLPAPTFRLKTMTGEEVDLEKLKGKVVILDFWATWCGPCKASLPAMQQEVNNYKSNPDVQFFFVDSWERGETAEKLKRTQEFIAKNKYEFTVLMDNDDAVIGKYKVEGIPTKFVIGKDGMIKFKTVGFDNADKLKKEMELMIGICLKQ